MPPGAQPARLLWPAHYNGRMLSIQGLVKRYGARIVLDGLNLVVEPGTVVAVVGESGSGKSTLLNLIGGLEPADAGHVVVAGTDLATLDDDARTRLRCRAIGFVFQAFHIIPHLTALENTVLPLVLLGVGTRERTQRAEEMLAAVGLGARGGAMPRELSGGELQRVAIARALVHRPALILADEPTGNLDPDTANAVLALLNSRARAGGTATILVTHSEAAAATADQVLRLERGKLLPRAAAPPPAGHDARMDDAQRTAERVAGNRTS
jgi:putative ABC transport system ATP-binding protein